MKKVGIFVLVRNIYLYLHRGGKVAMHQRLKCETDLISDYRNCN